MNYTKNGYFWPREERREELNFLILKDYTRNLSQAISRLEGRTDGLWVIESSVCMCVLMSGGGECESTASVCVLVCRCECTVRNSAAGWVFSASETYFFWRPRLEARRTNAKMREEIQEEASECLLKIQRGRTDVITPSEDLWQHRG